MNENFNAGWQAVLAGAAPAAGPARRLEAGVGAPGRLVRGGDAHLPAANRSTATPSSAGSPPCADHGRRDRPAPAPGTGRAPLAWSAAPPAPAAARAAPGWALVGGGGCDRGAGRGLALPGGGRAGARRLPGALAVARRDRSALHVLARGRRRTVGPVAARRAAAGRPRWSARSASTWCTPAIPGRSSPLLSNAIPQVICLIVRRRPGRASCSQSQCGNRRSDARRQRAGRCRAGRLLARRSRSSVGGASSPARRRGVRCSERVDDHPDRRGRVLPQPDQADRGHRREHHGHRHDHAGPTSSRFPDIAVWHEISPWYDTTNHQPLEPDVPHPRLRPQRPPS